MISSYHYHNAEHFNLELNKIFYNNWLFLGTKYELGIENDFVTLDIGRFSIVAQNRKGLVGAYKNICLHRFNKIQTGRRGNRPFFCSYHGWAYGTDGAAAVPRKFRDAIGLSDQLKLDTFVVDNCGIFYFIKLSDNPQPLPDFLGAYYKILEDFSKYIGEQIYNEEMPHKANWKLLIENVLECYHCRIVHSKTFIPMGIGIAPPINFRFSGKHNDCEYPKTKPSVALAKAEKMAFLESKAYKHESYHHIFIYPNLFISSTEGNLFYIGNFIPLSPDDTTLIVRFHSPIFNTPPEGKISPFLINAFFNVSVNSGLTILQEDKVILENIQSVVRKIDRNPIFGDEEFRINKFYESYFADLKE